MRITKSIERWFDVPDDPDKGRIKIKHLLPGETTDIIEEVLDTNISYKKDGDGKLEPIFSQTTNKKRDRELTLTKTVVDLENFFDTNGKLLECSNENIMRCSREIEGFNELITGFRKKLAEDIKQEQKEQLKNSKGSVSK